MISFVKRLFAAPKMRQDAYKPLSDAERARLKLLASSGFSGARQAQASLRQDIHAKLRASVQR